MTCQRGEVQTHQLDCFQDEELEGKKNLTLELTYARQIKQFCLSSGMS